MARRNEWLFYKAMTVAMAGVVGYMFMSYELHIQGYKFLAFTVIRNYPQ